MSQYRFTTEPVTIEWRIQRNKQPEMKTFMLIGIKNLQNNCIVIHSISEFILQWSNHQFATMRKHAVNVVAFLNFVLSLPPNEKPGSLTGLKISHGNKFLNNMTEHSRAYGTVKDSEKTLTKFFVFLKSKGILDSKIKLEKKQGLYGWYYSSPFDPIYPRTKIKNLEHTLPHQYIPWFFETAIVQANPILLGIYFQIFGGLRMGEVVNLSRADVLRKPTGEIVLNIRLRNFRKDIRTGHAGVKRARSQRVFNVNNWLDEFYSNHLLLYKPSDATNALFINRDGSPMSPGSYRQYFNKVKKQFIRELRAGSKEDIIVGNHLDAIKWSTHIGRGTFTNILAEEAENPYDIAQPRGDKNLLSSLSYMSGTERMRSKIQERLQNMHTNYIEILVEQRKSHLDKDK